MQIFQVILILIRTDLLILKLIFQINYYNKQNVVATKLNSITNYEKASVLIEKKEVILNFDAYTKREKIYNDQGIWIETKPLLIEEF